MQSALTSAMGADVLPPLPVTDMDGAISEERIAPPSLGTIGMDVQGIGILVVIIRNLLTTSLDSTIQLALNLNWARIRLISGSSRPADLSTLTIWDDCVVFIFFAKN
jgi:hypothetical protein